MAKAVVFRNEEIAQILATPALSGKRLLEPFKSFSAEDKFPLNILEDKEISNNAEVHKREGDLWHCLEGEVTFIHGGELVDSVSINENELTAKEIQGGEEIVVRKGDWFWIPAGVPHKHSASGTARLIIIKIPDISQKK